MPLPTIVSLQPDAGNAGGGNSGADQQGAGPLTRQLLPWLLPCGLLIGLAMLPLQALSALGFWVQRLWYESLEGLLDPMLPLGVACGSFTCLALAWGPLARGRGGGQLHADDAGVSRRQA